MGGRARPGLTLMELLVVMFIMAILTAFVASVLVQQVGTAREKKAMADMLKISMALDQHKKVFGEYPPDTGYGFRMEGGRPYYQKTTGGVVVMVPTYDPGSLWRYLVKPVDLPSGRTVGPFLEEWEQAQLKPYTHTDFDGAEHGSFYLSDPWGSPYGFVGARKRVVHSPGSFDLFSAGSDTVTACNNGEDDPPVGGGEGDGMADCSDEPSGDLLTIIDNRAYNTLHDGEKWCEYDDDGNSLANDSVEFGPEAIRNGDIGDDVNSWSAN